jgi:bifunctional non-homologous end joining protein LigD
MGAPPRIVPMLCDRDTSNARILKDPDFLFELKLDGVRILADRRGEHVALTYRTGRDATSTYPEIVAAMRALTRERVVLDGEVIAFDEEGRPDFERLGRRIQVSGRAASRAAASVPVMYVVFDVLALGEQDLRTRPIEERKRVLEEIAPPRGGHIRIHPTFDTGEDLFRLCREHRLEGVVAKRRGSIYRAGERSSDWIKVKCELDEDFVVIGWTEGSGARGNLGALDLGSYDERGDLVVRGSVGSGLDGETMDVLLECLRLIEVREPVAKGRYLPKRGRHFVKPAIVVSVRFTGITGDGLMRHPVFRGVRPDLRPEDCISGPTGGRRAKLPP